MDPEYNSPFSFHVLIFSIFTVKLFSDIPGENSNFMLCQKWNEVIFPSESLTVNA